MENEQTSTCTKPNGCLRLLIRGFITVFVCGVFIMVIPGIFYSVLRLVAHLFDNSEDTIYLIGAMIGMFLFPASLICGLAVASKLDRYLCRKIDTNGAVNQSFGKTLGINTIDVVVGIVLAKVVSSVVLPSDGHAANDVGGALLAPLVLLVFLFIVQIFPIFSPGRLFFKIFKSK